MSKSARDTRRAHELHLRKLREMRPTLKIEVRRF